MATDKDYDSQKYHRRSIRLKEYDYSSTGAYFITICTRNVDYLFGTIQEEKMVLNNIGCIVKNEWLKTPEIRSNVKLDEWVVMPNHFHAIVIIAKSSEKYNRPLNKQIKSPSQTLGAIVRGFKSAVTKQINLSFQSSEINLWQRNYYEHIIQNESDLCRIQKYIQNNPKNWQTDCFYSGENNRRGVLHTPFL